MAVWRSGSFHYLVGKLQHDRDASNEESYRCFIYEKTRGPTAYRIAQSGDASCSGISNPLEGARTFTLKKGRNSNGSMKLIFQVFKL